MKAAILSTAASKVKKSLLATEEDLLTCLVLQRALCAVVGERNYREQRLEVGLWQWPSMKHTACQSGKPSKYYNK